VKLVWRPEFTTNTFYRTYISAESAAFPGSELGTIPPPTLNSVSSDGCDNNNGFIALNWTNPLIEPDSIFIERSKDSLFSEVEEFRIAGTDESFDDMTAMIDTVYFYRLRSINECGAAGVYSTNTPLLRGQLKAEPAAPSFLIATPGENKIVLQWLDNSTSESSYELWRSIDGSNSSFLVDLPQNAMASAGTGYISIEDTQIEPCREYGYSVRAINSCGTSSFALSSNQRVKTLPAITNAFGGQGGSFTSSKGYYTNRVQLRWTLANNANSSIQRYNIERRVLGSNDSFVLLRQVSGQTIFNDELADAGIIYQYRIYGETRCGTDPQPIYSDTAMTVGFRSRTGLVAGNVSYEGGNAVKDVKIRAESTALGIGKSVNINGGRIRIESSSNQVIDTGFVFETWIKPTNYNNNFDVLKKTGSFEFSYNTGTDDYRLAIGGTDFITVSKDSFPVGQWNQLTVQVADSLYIFKNGVKQASKELSANPISIASSSSPIDLFAGFQGKVTELRLWNISKDSTQVARDASRHVVGNEKGLLVYLPMTEGAGDYVYDRSKISSSTFNKNDGRLLSGATFDNDIPTLSQLSFAAFTDTVGNYVLSLPYSNDSENYDLVPEYFTHDFFPKKRLVIIGDQGTVYNNVDFLDKSSFEMTGRVKYEGTTCSVEGAQLMIDGELVIVNGAIKKTDSDGIFTIQVPIGEHYVEVVKEGHTFSRGRWPEEEGVPWFFDAPLSTGDYFLDDTKIRLVGRAVGGTRESEKVPIIEESLNNIGITTILLKTNSCGWETGIPSFPVRTDTLIITDSLTGMYDVSLPPWFFTVNDVRLKNQVVTPLGFFGPEPAPIDLTYDVDKGIVQTLVTEYDTTFIDLTSANYTVDSIKYHQEVNFVHFAEPSIEVVNTDGSIFDGDKEYGFTHSKYRDSIIDLSVNNPFFPVLTSFRKYDVEIKLFEEYINIDQPDFTPDRVPIVRGELEIENNLAIEPSLIVPESRLDTLEGTLSYSFTGGEPNTLISLVDNNYSFTKIFNIKYTNPKGIDTDWLPFPEAIALGDNNPSANFRAYIFGSKLDEGTNHIVAGPNEIQYVLRDPPVGSGYASLLKGTSTTEFTNWSVSAGVGTSLDKNIKLGPKLKVGIGKITSIDVEMTTSIEFDGNTSLGSENTTQTTKEYTKTITTSSVANNVGDGSDLFIGESNIYLFGTSTNLGLFPVEACDDEFVLCQGEALGGYKVGKTRNYTLSDKTLATEFILSQTDIINYEIPRLELLRDQLLKKDPLYQSVIPDTLDQYYGFNNDDPVFMDKACRCYHFEPYPADGPPSYRFLGDRDSTDMVRKFNEDIANWKIALSQNEEDKATSTKLLNRFSFDGGGSTIELSSNVTKVKSNAFTWEVNLQEGVKVKNGAEVDGIGFDIENSVYLTQASSGNDGTQTDSVTTISYTLTDEDIWDTYTVEVIESKKGWGPIFKVVSGQTSCPHIGPVITEYYNKGLQLSEGTVRLEQPSLTVDNPVLRNVPEEDVAEFVFRLGNESTEGWAYRLGLLNQSNTGGAIIVNSGTSELGSDFVIGAGQEISQVIQIVKGGAYENDSLLFVLASTCQYDIGNDFDEDIADTVYVSVSFVPGCVDLTIDEPQNNWVLNTNFDDEMEIVVTDYNVNNVNFESFTIQYKPSNDPDWIPLKTYFVDGEDALNSNLQSKDSIDLNAIGTKFVWRPFRPGVPDTRYDLRAIADCSIATSESEISSGYMDRDRIEVFGTPSPADGILDPNDDILLTMNEIIETGGVGPDNFQVRGVMNGTKLEHSTSLSFDGNISMATIPEYQLQNRSFTFDFWLKRTRTGEEVILSQGTNPNGQLTIGFDANDKMKFELGDASMTSDLVVTTQDWKHYAVIYNHNDRKAEIIIADLIRSTAHVTPKSGFDPNYAQSSSIVIGRNQATSETPFKGFIHELRLWSRTQSLNDLIIYRNATLSGREEGLVGNWAMDEAIGNRAIDKVRSRHAALSGTTWSILPANNSFQFNGTSDYLVANGTGDLTFDDEVDLTFELWFKTGEQREQVLLSNGRADGLSSGGLPIDDKSWKIFLTDQGRVMLQSNANTISTDTSYNDNNWHHVSAVFERGKSASLYMDGELVKTGNARDFKGFSGIKLWVGALGWLRSGQDTISTFFEGNIDDIRIWNLARKPEQVKRDMVNQLIGDELGLQYYYPFDGIKLMGEVMVRDPNLIDATDPLVDTIGYDLSLGVDTIGGVAFATGMNFDNTTAPPIKLPRLIEIANIDYSINDDQVFIQITDPTERVENVTFDITVTGLRDEAGNFMKGPETWTAYIDKNQVFWDVEYFNFEKDLGEELSFTATIKNTGGSQEQFNIGNLPSWLKASTTTGLIAPNSEVRVTFIVEPLLNIGEYEQDIFVSTESFKFNERLLLDLKVSVEAPDWEIDEDAFDQSMNIVGELKINDVISTDVEDMVSVWVNDELRGVSHVEYDEPSGKNLVFLTVLSNENSGEELEFRAWDASAGRLLKGLMPDDLDFVGGTVVSSRTNPLPIKATVLTQLSYVLTPGWNWISFPLDHPDLASLNKVLKELSPTAGDLFKGQDLGDPKSNQYSESGWMGNDTTVSTNLGYKIMVAKADTFRYEGTFLDPTTEPINVKNGWNWIGVKSEFIIDVPSAMSSLEPQTGDVIKGQRSFAIYEEGFGWGGNLDFLKPQEGYMLFYHQTDQLIFQGNANAISKPQTQLKSRSNNGKEYARLEKSQGYSAGKYSSTMSLTAEVDECIALETEGTLDLSQWSLTAHAGGECRGIVASSYIASIDKHLFYLSIDGGATEALNFKLVHNINGQEISLSQQMNFSSNAVTGSSLAPYKFSCVALPDCINTTLYQNADIDMSQTDITQQVLTDH